MGSECFDPAEYLTRSDIARILKISTKQAGRLMDRMPTLRVGRTHRRVSQVDFDAWRMREREAPAERARMDPRQAAMRRATHHLRGVVTPSSGRVWEAAKSLRKREL